MWNVAAAAVLLSCAAAGSSGASMTATNGAIYVSLAASGGSVAVSSDGGVVAALPAGEDHQTWTPDGTEYAFSDGRSLNLAHGDGGDPTAVNLESQDPTVQTFTNQALWPTFSPDGGSLAFQGVDQPGNSHILLAAAGQTPRLLTSGAGFDWQPAWPPAGNEIVFTRVQGNYESLWAVNLFGGERKLILGGPSNAFSTNASWSPDGSTIAFAQTGTAGWHLAVVHPDGSGYQQLLPDDTQLSPVTATAWSPDGRQIAFVTAHGRLNVVNADGSDPHEIYSAPTDIIRLSWRSVSPALAVTSLGQLDQLLVRRSTEKLTIAVGAVGGADLQGATAHVTFSSPVTASASAGSVVCSGGSAVTCPLGTVRGDTNVPITLSFRPLVAGPVLVTVSATAANQVGSTADDSTTLRTVVSPCTILGTADADKLRAPRAGGSYICGEGGKDTIYAANGRKDVIDGGPGRDTAIVDRNDIVRRVERVTRH